LSDGSRWKIKVTYKEEAELLGTAGGVKGFSEALRVIPSWSSMEITIALFDSMSLIHAHFCHAPSRHVSRPIQQMMFWKRVAVCDQTT